jgi:ATP/maltotriose-dependent transcriptional regulator MalT
MCSRAWLTWFVGAPEEAQRRMDEALEFATVEGDPHARTFVLGYAACLAQCRGDTARAFDLASETLTLAREHGLEYWIAWGQALRGWAVARAVDAAAGIAELRAGIAAYAATGAAQMRAYFLMLAAELLVESDRAAALATLDEALASAHTTGVRFHEPEIQRLIATVAAAAGRPPATIERALTEGRDLAQAQGGKMLELRCLAAGARLIVDPATARAWRAARDALAGTLGSEAASSDVRGLLDAAREPSPAGSPARPLRAPSML